MIALCPNPYRDLELNTTRRAKQLLEEAGFDTVVCPVFAEEDPSVLPSDLQTVSIESVTDKCSLAVVIGGDGTILSVARLLRQKAVPLLGVNLGTKGFLATLEEEELPLIVNAARGEYRVSRRMMLEATLEREGEAIFSDHALNDVVIHGYGECVYLTATCDGDGITAFSGDGIILSTPTGSTGYSMSAGGPIVEPSAEAIILSPICAHMLGARSFVLSPGRSVSVKLKMAHGRRAYLSVDGSINIDLENMDTITVRKSNLLILMADLGLRSFYQIAYEKLS